MANLASILKSEIARVARREIKNQTAALQTAVSRYRKDIAALKREVAAHSKELKRVPRQVKERRIADTADGEAKYRFSPKRLAAHRARLALSADAMGKLLGVTGSAVYLWETGKARPNPRFMPAIAALRTLSPKTAAKVLEA